MNEIHNSRIYDRNLPSQMLQPYLSVRPVMTKYSFMPIVDPRKEISVKLEQQPTYNSNVVFNPGNDMSPWSGYSSGVNIESELRGQIFALQKCDQSVYVPNSNSDLYKHSFRASSGSCSSSCASSSEQNHNLLFKKENFCDFNPLPNNVSMGLFNNSTRTAMLPL
jgi:hypothetical protein